MQFQEFPKALYKGGQQLVVDNAEQEDAAREAGHLDWHDDQARLNEPDDEQLDREALKARAAELKLEYPRNVTTERLAEMVAAAEVK